MESGLGYDYHQHMEPTVMEGRGSGDVNKRGYGPYGETVWLHGPEPLGPRGGQRWALRTRTHQAGWLPSHQVWNGGCSTYDSKAEATAAFQARVLT